jgi:hypothetical protein
VGVRAGTGPLRSVAEDAERPKRRRKPPPVMQLELQSVIWIALDNEAGGRNMNLNFDIAWELSPPPDGTYINCKIPADAVGQFYELLRKSAHRTNDPEEAYYLIRAEFSEAVGHPVYRSSSMYFAPDDARAAMERASSNAPVFVAAYYGACKRIKKQFGTKAVPSVAVINRMLELHRIGYVVVPPNLVLRDQVQVIPVRPSCVLEQAQAKFQETIERSRKLLEEGNGDEAVTQIWWLLESITLSFSGTTLNGQPVAGSYFNEVAKSLKRNAGDAAVMGAVSRWLEALQSYLSGPGEAGIRHGRHLHMEGLKRHEAELFCNLTRSYISYLLAEYEMLTDTNAES